jgi:tetratricopeptide (TPR) repeat protein
VLDAFAPAGAPARAASTPRAPVPPPAGAPAGAVAAVETEAPSLAPLPGGASTRGAVVVAAASLIGISLLPAKAGWYTHDRSGFYIAHDYAYNMLTPLEKNAVVFTNGDNDTFPLWYIQEVEGVRPDVRVVNMSLLNTPWYIAQLRDQAPKVPISYNDTQLGAVQPYLDEKTNNVVWVKDQAFADIVKTNAWRQPLYLAVTVPDQEGMDKQLTFEGLVFRIRPEPDPVGINAPRTYENLYHVYQYRGLLDKNRTYDRSVYKDDNANRLVQNYTAAHVQLATYLLQQKKADDAVRILQDAVKISPDFPGLLEYMGRVYEEAGRPDLARKVYEDGVRRFPAAAEFHYHIGLALFNEGKAEQGIAELRRACELSQQFFDWFNALFAALWSVGRQQEGLEVLRTWTRAHPDDAQAMAYLRRYEDSLRTSPGGPPSGRPPAATP